jgi:radical SAM protein with 4Fe4S-binding SPASM domain
MGIPPPFLVSYSITSRCNLACRHCYSESSDKAGSDDLPIKDTLKVIDDLAGWSIGLLIFDGGEPLCREDFFEVAGYASSKGIRTVIGSNGTMIDRATARKLLSSGIQSVAISIDGADAETHDSFRGKAGAFQEALRGASSCKAEGLPFQFNMVIRKQTLSQVPDMLRLASESGAEAAELFDLVAAGRAKRECQEQLLSLSERRDVMEWLAEAQVDCPIVIRVPGCPMYPLILKQKRIQPKLIAPEMLMRIPYYRRGCAAGMPFGYLVIRANGEVNPCMLLQLDLGNVKEKGIREIWQQAPALAQLRSRDLLKGNCSKCEQRDACAGCRGRAYEATGDMMAADPGCWLAPELATKDISDTKGLRLIKQ